MAIFQRKDLPKSNYIVSIVAKIKKGTPIKVKDGKSIKFKKTKRFLHRLFNDFQQISDPTFEPSCAKLALKAPLEAPLGALGRHLGSKMLPRRPPEPPRPFEGESGPNFESRKF